MDYFDSRIFGSIPSPETIGQLLSLVKEHSSETRNVYFWRGQGNIDWAIHSSAYRRLNKNGAEVTEREVQYYEKYLLNKATHQGYRYHEGRMLNDFELLAKLQHHGAATRFIDFSRNILVGLWFACSSKPNENGLLFGFHANYVGGSENRLGLGEKPYIEAFKDIENVNHPLVWHPPVISKRIASQNAQFLYSKVVDTSYGSLAIGSDKSKFICFNLTPDFKKTAINDLKEIFDIRYITLFPDLDGFGYANSFRFYKFEDERY